MYARILVSCASTHCTQSLLTGSVLACFRYCCWLGMPNPQGKQQHKVNSHHATPFGKHLPTSQHQCCPAHARRYLESGVQTLVVCQSCAAALLDTWPNMRKSPRIPKASNKERTELADCHTTDAILMLAKQHKCAPSSGCSERLPVHMLPRSGSPLPHRYEQLSHQEQYCPIRRTLPAGPSPQHVLRL